MHSHCSPQSPFPRQTKKERAQPLDVQPLPQNTATHLKRCCPISAAGAGMCLHLLTFGEAVHSAAMCRAGRHKMRSGKQSHVRYFPRSAPWEAPRPEERQLCLSTDGMQRQCLLSDKGNYVAKAKDGFCQDFFFLPSIILITYISSLIHHPLTPSHLTICA